MFSFKRKEAPGEAPAAAAGAAPTPEGKLLTVAEILAADDVRTKRVHVPEWGGDVIVGNITAGARDLFERELVDEQGQPRDLQHVRALTVAMACRHPDGRVLFRPEDIPKLLEKNSAVIDRLVIEVGALDTLAAEVEAATQD